MYNVSHGFAEACECGPLGTAVIRNNTDEVARLISRHPGSLSELDTFGQSPLHLAAEKPQILSILVKAAGSGMLDQQDYSGSTALEAAMALSSKNCINGKSAHMCQDCGCVKCVDILLGAGSKARGTLD
ncbi:hypothetical protein PG991_013941 [Apiospora marii]|uniref:Ankyrin n=1 Tax=Apiospora marii TaxID=335849 RepID=A0ABR1R7F2_9PEZI